MKVYEKGQLKLYCLRLFSFNGWILILYTLNINLSENEISIHEMHMIRIQLCMFTTNITFFLGEKLELHALRSYVPHN